METLKTILKRAGFSEKEVEVYLAMRELGAAVVSDIAKRAGIIRSTAYVVLGSLEKRGLVGISERRGVKIYQAMPPDQLAKHLESTAKQYVESAGEVRKLLPKLKLETPRTSVRPKVRVFEGNEGMKTVYEDALSSLETVRTYAFEKNQTAKELLPRNYYSRLAKNKVKIRALFPDAVSTRGLAKANAGEYDFSPDISVYDNKIVFMSSEEKFGLIIESKELAEALKKAFDLSWKETKSAGKITLDLAGKGA